MIIIIAAFGAALGSFFNVLIHRIPNKQSIIFPASHCDGCKKHIPFYQNIPIISYIILKGKCSKCGASIHWHHLLVEVITPLLFVGIFLRYGISDVLFFKYLLLFSFLIPIFFIDAFHNIIPHVLSIPLIGIGILTSMLPGNNVGLIESVLTALFIFCFLLLLAWAYQKVRGVDGLGGGDIWLLTGIASFFGLQGMPFIFILAASLGILYFLIFIRDKDKEFAFGTFIAAATVFWVLLGQELILGFFKLY
ncbi:MAG: prepilin peptidase [Candidatus Cloacimonetes bacterium HGW-Cloacimonetes-3]|jgi:leader peptidase (prepilin peptidase)/N-methyltransferase|nr:MAG: prepilin peptidase [Candidatus Cloacimonetes bacterium HGW-Cloacimonetes-3]